MKVSQTLRNHADSLELGAYAWVNHTPGSDDGDRKEACLMYRYDPDAVNPFYPISEDDPDAVDPFQPISEGGVDYWLVTALHVREPRWDGGIISWNDAQTDVRPVIELLRAAADLAEANDE